jgi:hypothetical protein
MKKFNVIVEKPFLDRRTGLKRKKGDRMTIAEDRYNEIRRSGKDYITIEKAAAKVEKTDKATIEIKK